MAYHSLSVRSLRIYQDCKRKRLTACSADDALQDVLAALSFRSAEPGAADCKALADAFRVSFTYRAKQSLAACRKARGILATGTWQGESAPLDLSEAQADLWRVRDERRAILSAIAACEAL
jgi:hypothetical protein